MSELIESFPMCQCGCGLQVTKKENRFISGHNTRGTKKSEETRKKMSISQKRIHKHQNHKGQKNPNWRGGKSQLITKFCQNCGNEYQCSPYNAKSSKYCSRKCKNLAQKRQPSWAKGLTSNPTKSNYDPRIVVGLKGKANPMYGRKVILSAKARARISIANSGSKNGMWVDFEDRICECGKTFNVKKTSKQKYCSKICTCKARGVLEPYLKTHTMNEAFRKATSLRMKRHNPMKNPKISAKVSKILREKYQHELHPNKGNKRPDQSKRWKKNNPMWKCENVIKSIKRQKRRPNKLEIKFTKFLEENDLPFNYTGDGKFFVTVSGKPNKVVRNPDFTYKDVTKKKIVIEVGCKFWHPKNNVDDMLSQYKRVNWTALYFSQKEFYNNPKKIKETILNALG